MKKNRLELTKEEKDLSMAYENGLFESSKNLSKRKKELSKYAQNTLKKDARINIRIAQKDMSEIKEKALEHGLPYQTLISTVLHNYASGKIKITL